MPYFCVEVNGTNFQIFIDGKIQDAGFISRQLVEASDALQAEELAIQAVMQLEGYDSIIGSPKLKIEETEGLSKSEFDMRSSTGLIFYKS
ncbi:MAG: hypothetical protein EP312_00780 [Gammaproteobacteria bacterium]|nr:MAG: hypothetical protein EP312_00780 [Gammaproteobacteria bacterium]